MTDVLVEVTRGPLVETVHRGAIAVVDAHGTLLWYAGDPRLVTYWRSSAKPFQAMPLHYTGTLDRFGYDPADLALFCASHVGSRDHRERVAAALARAGLTPAHLECGTHMPVDREAQQELHRTGQEPTVLHCNCSGKHTGMLAMAVHLGYPTAGYLEPDHPVQQIILENVTLMTGLSRAAIALGVDGCGVPTFGLPLTAMALAFARLADPDAIPAGAGDADLPAGFAPPPPEERRAAAQRVRDAMIAHPEMVRGAGGLDTVLMRAAGGALVTKTGASAVYCVGVLPRAARAAGPLARARGGVGIAVKVADGNDRARDVAVLECLHQLGLLTDAMAAALAPFRRPPVKNNAGRVVGEFRPVFRLQPA